MCGIAGIIGPQAGQKRDAVKQMLAAMTHRGPDGEGLYTSPSGMCALGFCRLAILDLSEAASQPMHCHDRWSMVYNGECYNFKELREELASQGEKFQSTGDTEVVLRLLTKYSAKGLSRLNGMYAIALWDEAEQQVLLARDRFGQKPLYYAWHENHLIFASEIRALLASGLIKSEVNLPSVTSYLSYGVVQGPETIIKNVHLLAKNSYLSFKLPSTTQYADIVDFSGNIKQPCSQEELRDLFSRAVQRHLISDAPLGLFLSGGLDSSAIAVTAKRIASEPLNSLSVVFPEFPGSSETETSNLIAKYAGTKHHEVAVTASEVMQLLPRMLDSLDQPTVDGLNVYLVSHAAHKLGLKVALSGLGSDELFGGYPSFRDVPRVLKLRKYGDPLLSLLVRSILTSAPKTRRSEKLKDLFVAPADIKNMFLARRRIFTMEDLKHSTIGNSDTESLSGLNRERLAMLDKLIAGLPEADAIGSLELDFYMGQMLLRDTDIMGMTNNLEIRCPFLDTEFADRVLSLAPEIRQPKAVAKWFFAQSMEEWLPPGHISQRKRPFELPFTQWLSGPLRPEVEESIERLSSLNWPFSGVYMRQLWKRFQESPAQIGWVRLWNLFILDRYLSKYGLLP